HLQGVRISRNHADDALGDGNLAAIVGDERMEGDNEPALLVLARPQRTARQPDWADGQSRVLLQRRRLVYPWRHCPRGAADAQPDLCLDRGRLCLFADDAHGQYGLSDALYGADLWLEIRLSRAASSRSRKRHQFLSDGFRPV